MSDAKQLRIPLLNPNEIDGILAGLHVKEGQKVKSGDVLYTLETSKSAADVEAEDSGYLIHLQVAEGDTISAGDLFAYLAKSPDWQPPKQEIIITNDLDPNQIPEGLRITKPALTLAQENALDLTNFQIGPMITESIVRSKIADKQVNYAKTVKDSYDENAILIYGGGGHGKSVIDLLRALDKYPIIGIIDEGLSVDSDIMGIPVLGGKEILSKLYENGVRFAVNAVGGIGNVQSRISVFKRLSEAGFTCPTVIHPSAYVETTANLSLGVQVFPLAYVGSAVKLGFGTIINTGAIVSHDCQIGDYVNISPGAILAGAVNIGDLSLVGMGTTINLNAQIGERSLIGNGATVKSDVPPGGMVRAGTVWPK